MSQAPRQTPQILAEIEPTAASLSVSADELVLDQGAADLFMRTVDKYGNESPESELQKFGTSLSLSSATAAESNCFVASVNDREFCDITVALELNYEAPLTPVTISCILASSSEGASTTVEIPSGTVQLGFTDMIINMEYRAVYPVLFCRMEPDDSTFVLQYDYGNFTPP